MKRLLSLLLILVLTLSLFAGCDGAEEPDPVPVGEPAWVEMGTPLADVRIKQALIYAIDMEGIIDTLFEGSSTFAESLTAEGPFRSDNLTTYSYNPELAKELLAEAGWPEDYVLDVVYYYADQQTVDLMAIIQNYWAAVGVQAKFRLLEGDLASQLWTAPADKVNGPSEVLWDIAYGAVVGLVQGEYYDRFHSTASMNSTVPHDPELDKLLEATWSAVAIDDRTEAYKELQEYMNENITQLPLYHAPAAIFVSDQLEIPEEAIGNENYSFNKNVLDWVTTREDGMIYTNGGPEQFYQGMHTNPGLFPYQEFLFDRLINANGALEPTTPHLAESYTLSDDGMEIEFVLREGVKWHDGEDFDAEDVVFTFEYYSKVAGANPIMSGTVRSLEGADEYIDGSADSISGIKVEGNIVTFTFETFNANVLQTFSQWAILPEHLLSDASTTAPQQEQFWQSPIGTGPFKVKETVFQNYAIMERNDDYFLEGTGNVEAIYMFASMDNDPNLVMNAEAGLIDYSWSKTQADISAISAMDNMTTYPIDIGMTRLFYINQYPHESNIG